MTFDPEGINMFWKALAAVTLAALFYLEMTRIEIIPAPQGARCPLSGFLAPLAA